MGGARVEKGSLSSWRPEEGRDSTMGNTQTSPRSSSPFALSTKASTTGDKAENPVTLRAPSVARK